MAFYEKISDYIKQNGIKQTFIADKCGWTKQKLYNLLHGRNRISVEDYEAICEALSVPFDFFVRIRQTPPAAADGGCGKLVCCRDECI